MQIFWLTASPRPEHMSCQVVLSHFVQQQKSLPPASCCQEHIHGTPVGYCIRLARTTTSRDQMNSLNTTFLKRQRLRKGFTRMNFNIDSEDLQFVTASWPESFSWAILGAMPMQFPNFRPRRLSEMSCNGSRSPDPFAKWPSRSSSTGPSSIILWMLWAYTLKSLQGFVDPNHTLEAFEVLEVQGVLCKPKTAWNSNVLLQWLYLYCFVALVKFKTCHISPDLHLGILHLSQ